MVPESWEIRQVGEIAHVLRGASPRPKGDPRYYGGNVPRLMVSDVTRDGKYVTPQTDFLTEEGAKLSRPMPADTLTIVCSGTVGIPCLLKVDACIHDGFLALDSLSESCNRNYLYYVFFSLRREFDSAATHGGVFTNLTTEILRNFKILLPPLDEQEKIAEILGSVDEAIATTQAVIDQTRKVKQGLLQQLLTRGITHTKFKETAIGLIPESWEIKTIRDLVIKQANSLTAGPFGTIFKAKDFRTEGVPIVQIRHVTEDGFSWGNKTTYMDEEVYKIFHQPYTVRGGDLLITKMGEPPGVACLYPKHEVFGMVTPDVIKAAIDPDQADTYFMMCLYNSPPMKKCILELTKGGTRARITLGEFYKLPLPIPPIKEQIEISEVLSGLDSEIQSEIKKLERCEKIKRGLMQDLLTGQVRVEAVA